MTDQTTQHAHKQLSFGLGLLGICCGFLAAYGVLTGDSEGRVNLLYLLLLFAFLPIAGLLLSVLLIAKGGGKGLAGWLLELPLWPRHLTLSLTQLGSDASRKLWLFYQTQIVAVAFSAGCLLLYLLLLLGSDITFVWRSTLLQADDLLPALQAIALPWRFWPEAQASLALIEQTQDFRLNTQDTSAPAVGLWWQYILAAQLTYNLIPRSVMLLIARHKYQSQILAPATQTTTADSSFGAKKFTGEPALAEITTSVPLPYTLLDWAKTPDEIQQLVQQQLGGATKSVSLDPLSETESYSADGSLVLLVKSWEPPLAELADRLQSLAANAATTGTTNGNTQTYKVILPLDWNENSLRQPGAAHLDEWRRFTATLPDWQVLQLEGKP